METILDDNRSMTFRMTVTAMFAAVTAVASWISVPLPFTPVPINLATLAVTLAGAVLGYKYGTTSVLIYILLGAAGVPVFAGFTGGLGHIAGPPGGYIVGYLTSAFITGIVFRITCKDKIRWYWAAAAAFLGTASCYILGTIWFMVLTGNGLAASLSMCVIPFIPGDIFKITAFVLIITALDPVLKRFAVSR